MKKILLSLFLVVVCVTLNAQNRIYNDLKNTYYSIYKFNKIEVTPTQTIADVSVEYYPNYWVSLSNNRYLIDDNGKRYKLLSSDNFPINERNVIPASGKQSAKLYFESLSKDAHSLDFIEVSADKKSNTYGIILKEEKQFLPKAFLGNWLTTDGRNQFMYGLHEKVALMDTKIWDYVSVQKRGSTMEILLRCGSEKRKIVAKLSKNGNLLCGIDSKSLVELSRDFTESKIANSDWVFSPDKYRNKIYKPGKAVLRGYFPDYTPSLGFKTSNLKFSDLVLEKDISVIFEIQPDGKFEAVLDMEHPMYLLCIELKSNMLIAPGDTLLVTGSFQTTYKPISPNSRENTSLKYMGSNESADINNLGTIIKSKIAASSTNYRQLQISSSKGMTELLKLKKMLLKDINTLRDSSSVVFSRYATSNYVKDMLFTNMIVDKFTSLLDIAMYYNDSKYINTKDSLGENALQVNKDFVPLQNYYTFATDYQTSILDNPLLVCSFSTWVPFNRFEFSEMFCCSPKLVADEKFRIKVLEYTYKKDKITPSDSVQDELNRYIKTGYLMGHISDEMKNIIELNNKNISAVTYVQPTEIEIAEITYNHYHSLGFDKSIIYDYSVARSICTFYNSREISSDYLLDNISSQLPFIKTPYVAKKLMQFYAEKTQSTVIAKANNLKADEIFERIIAPYKGNVLVIDFWSTGCGPCRAGMIATRDMVERLKDKKIKFLYITDETQSPMNSYTKFLSENNIKGEQIRVSQDDWNYLTIKFGISSIPHHALVGKDGKIISLKSNDANSEIKLLEYIEAS